MRQLERVIEKLDAHFGPKMSLSRDDRNAHGQGESLEGVYPPDAVVYASTLYDVVAVVRECAAEGVPIIPYGAGTSLEGQVHATRGGICVDMSRMNRILSVSQTDLDCRVEAGVTREQLNQNLRDQGLFFPLDPGANASIGGMAATRASGTNAVRYGTMREVTLGLTVVTPDAKVIRTGTRARKTAAGYDLTRLYLGSEGTLGIITELQLRLFGIPESIVAGVCQFSDLSSAVEAVISIMQMGVDVARIELLDREMMSASISHSKITGFMPSPTLFFEFHGSPATTHENLSLAQQICGASNGGPIHTATSPEQRNELWQARHDAYWAARSLGKDRSVIITDACVPISSLVECIIRAKAAAESFGLAAPIVGHVGDGNFHMMLLYDPEQPAEIEGARHVAEAVSRHAIACGGTFTGEHGVGSQRIGLLEYEHGEAVQIMRRIKSSLDPNGIMNPGKMIRM